MERADEYLLSLKVNRVVLKEPKDFLHFISLHEYEQIMKTPQDLPQDHLLPAELASKWHILTKNFTKTYLGEAISFFMSITNDSVKEDVSEVSIQIDLQLSNSHVLPLGKFSNDELEAKKTISKIFHHEVKELGKHLLIFTVNYKLQSTEIQAFRKTFQFWVDKPLDIKTKFFNAENDEIYLEANLQNLSVVPICLEKVFLEPSEYFDVKDMNYIEVSDSNDSSKLKKRLVFGEKNRFNPMDCRQYLFCMSPKKDIEEKMHLLRSVKNIGKLDIIWTSAIGIKGRLQTPQLERMITLPKDLKLEINEIPSKVKLREKFNVEFKIINISDKIIKPVLYFDNVSGQSIYWLGVSEIISPTALNPLQTCEFSVIAYAIKEGLQQIPLVRVQDRNTKTTYDFEDVAFVFVD